MSTVAIDFHEVDILKTIPKETLNSCVKEGSMYVRSYSKKSVVYHPMAPCETFDIILNGELTVERYDVDGNVVHITTFEQGKTVGGNLMFASSCVYPFEISSRKASSILHIRRDAVVTFLETNRSFLLKFMNDLSNKASFLTHTIDTLSERSLRVKVVQYIRREAHLQNSKKIELKVSKKLLAERLGVARPSLSRELKAMKDEGIIDYDTKHITLLSELD